MSTHVKNAKVDNYTFPTISEEKKNYA